MKAKPAESDGPRTEVAIVEDNATLRRYLAKLVSDAGSRPVSTCGSAEEAIVKIPECKPQVVLMNIHLPGESDPNIHLN